MIDTKLSKQQKDVAELFVYQNIKILNAIKQIYPDKGEKRAETIRRKLLLNAEFCEYIELLQKEESQSLFLKRDKMIVELQNLYETLRDSNKYYAAVEVLKILTNILKLDNNDININLNNIEPIQITYIKPE